MAGTANVDRFRPTAADSKTTVFHATAEGHAKTFVCNSPTRVAWDRVARGRLMRESPTGSEGAGIFATRILHSNRSVVSQGLAGVVFQDYKRWVSNPLLGGAEAKGFGVGVRDEEPTPVLRYRCRCAPPLPRGDFRANINTDAKFRC